MQANRDQQKVKEGVNPCPDGAELLNMFAKAHLTVKDHRLDVHQDKGCRDHKEGDENRHQTSTAEEQSSRHLATGANLFYNKKYWH